jgi:antitoxin HicB
LLLYPIELTPDDNGTVLVTCPDLPEVTTFASDRAEALLRARDAIEEALAHRVADLEDTPPPSPAAGRPVAALPMLSLANVELYRAMRADGLPPAELADRLGVPGAAVDRMLDLNHRTALPELEAAFRALGRQLGIEVWQAA